MHFITTPAELCNDIFGKKFCVAACHIDINIFPSHQAVQNGLKISEKLHFVQQHIVLILVVNPFGQIRKEYFRIPILFILIGIKSHLYDMIVRNLALPEILSEQLKKQIRFSASANPGNDLDQPIMTLGNQLVQIGVPANFHFHHPRLIMIQKCGIRSFVHLHGSSYHTGCR